MWMTHTRKEISRNTAKGLQLAAPPRVTVISHLAAPVASVASASAPTEPTMKVASQPPFWEYSCQLSTSMPGNMNRQVPISATQVVFNTGIQEEAIHATNITAITASAFFSRVVRGPLPWTISRAFFMAGRKPYPFMDAVNASLYLSTNAEQVREAVSLGYPAGHVLPCAATDDASDDQLRLAFDFDGVLADDEAEKVYKAGDLEQFQQYELENKDRPLGPGPLTALMRRLAHFQELDASLVKADPSRQRLLRVAIVTARSAPAHERFVHTLSAWGMEADEVFLLGGIEKKRVLDILKPHLFFDDQMAHLTPAHASTPCVHIPFGIANPEPGT